MQRVFQNTEFLPKHTKLSFLKHTDIFFKTESFLKYWEFSKTQSLFQNAESFHFQKHREFSKAQRVSQNTESFPKHSVFSILYAREFIFIVQL